MTILESLKPENVFTKGEYINFDQVEAGDTIVRGGRTVYGEPMNYGFHIARAHDKDTSELFPYTDEAVNPHLIQAWNSEDVSLGSPAAFKFENNTLPQPYLYRLPLDEFKTLQLGNLKWTEAVIGLIKLNRTSIQFDDIAKDMIILDVWMKDRESEKRGEWVDEISIGVAGRKVSSFGWEMPDVRNYLIADTCSGEETNPNKLYHLTF